MVSEADCFKRVLVTLLRTLAGTYGCRVTVARESKDPEVRRAYRTVSHKVHPDRGGSTADQQRLNEAYANWCNALRERGARGRPASQDGLVATVSTKGAWKAFLFNAAAVLLTFQGFSAVLSEALEQWCRFLVFVKGSLRTWAATRWTATLETNANGAHHAHLMVQFTRRKQRSSTDFVFERLRPNAAANDLLGEGWSKKRWQTSVDRGHFYCYANKRGTVRDSSGKLCVDGNYAPAWTGDLCTYPVLGAWPEKLWKAYKLDDDQYDEYLHLCKDGLPSRKRNFDEYRSWTKRKASEKKVAERTKRIRSNPALYQPFARVPEADEWLDLFKHDALRYPVLLVHGKSRVGKTEWAESLFQRPLVLKVGTNTQFPDKARQLDREKHDGLVLDDVRDLEFLSDHQEALQGKYSGEVELGTTPSGQYAFEVDLYRLPVVATVNDSTKNLSYLSSHDFVADRGNVRLLSFQGRPGLVPPTTDLNP